MVGTTDRGISACLELIKLKEETLVDKKRRVVQMNNAEAGTDMPQNLTGLK